MSLPCVKGILQILTNNSTGVSFNFLVSSYNMTNPQEIVLLKVKLTVLKEMRKIKEENNKFFLTF